MPQISKLSFNSKQTTSANRIWWKVSKLEDKSVDGSFDKTQPMSNDANANLLQQQLLQQQLLLQNTQNQDDEIDLAELWRAIWAGKFTIIIISMLFAVASVLFALSKPNIYKASAILAPAASESGAGGLGALAGQFGGLASMAGINLGGGGGDKTALALEIIKSSKCYWIRQTLYKNSA